ncbi:MAG: PIN domain-containing protein [Thermoprotei archaeon]
MKSSDKLRILLDSTYLLPILGVEVAGLEDTLRILAEISRANRAEFYYTPFNILEVMGKIAKTRYDREVVSKGLRLIVEEFIEITPTCEGYLKALELRRKGFKDLIDLLLYSTALTRNLLFLTRDRELIEFLEGIGEKTHNILIEEKLEEINL